MTERIAEFVRRAVTVFILIGAAVVTGGAVYGDTLQGEGKWRSDSSEFISGTWSLAVERSDDVVRGRIKLHGSNVFDGGDVKGRVDGSDIVFGLLSEVDPEFRTSG